MNLEHAKAILKKYGILEEIDSMNKQQLEEALAYIERAIEIQSNLH